LDAAKGKSVRLQKHLDGCPECREAAELLRQFSLAGKLSLPQPPTGWTERAKALALKPTGHGIVARLLARVAFDSWAVVQPVGVRGMSSLGHRRMRFESGALALDLRAEKSKEGWAFVAQVQGSEGQLPQLRANRKILHPDANGVYQWSSNLPPRTIFLSTNELTIELPNLTWKTPRPTKR
jgi:hypothetical protein